MIELILEQSRQGKTIFMSSHIFKELEDICDQVVFIYYGEFMNILEGREYYENIGKIYKIGYQEALEKMLDEKTN